MKTALLKSNNLESLESILDSYNLLINKYKLEEDYYVDIIYKIIQKRNKKHVYSITQKLINKFGYFPSDKLYNKNFKKKSFEHF